MDVFFWLCSSVRITAGRTKSGPAARRISEIETALEPRGGRTARAGRAAAGDWRFRPDGFFVTARAEGLAARPRLGALTASGVAEN
jgi:hypothetical protein